MYSSEGAEYETVQPGLRHCESDAGGRSNPVLPLQTFNQACVIASPTQEGEAIPHYYCKRSTRGDVIPGTRSEQLTHITVGY